MKISPSIYHFIDLQRDGYKGNYNKYAEQIEKEFEEMKPFLPKKCTSVLDIGAGLAGIEVFLNKHYNDIFFNLVDQDKIDKDIHYGYKANGSFYNSFDATKELFSLNSVNGFCFISASKGDDVKIKTKQDIIISLLSCGYHYPVIFYIHKIYELLSDTGVLIIDIREHTDGVKELKKYFSSIKTISHYNKSYRVCVSGKIVDQKKKVIVGDKTKERPIPYLGKMRWDAVLKRIPDGVTMMGVEIGVLCGDTAYQILNNRPLVTHVMIDPWEIQSLDSSFRKSGDNCSKKPQGYHDTAYELTCKRVKEFGDRAIIKRMYSVEAVKDIPNKSLDYVFIDGDHSYDGCKRDITAWISKVKSSGWIGGHDYGMKRTPGVKKSVDEYFGVDNIELDYEDTWFYCVK